MSIQINLCDTRETFASGRVEVNRNRYRGSPQQKNVFALYEMSAIGKCQYGLFVQPSSSDYTSLELAGRLLKDNTAARAKDILAGGKIGELEVRVDFVNKEMATIETIAPLLAEAFLHKVMDDFLAASLSFKGEPVVGCTSIHQLLKLHRN